jgi:predicted Zn-dependent protease
MISTEPTAGTLYTCTYFENENVAKKSAEQALTSSRDGTLGKIQGKVLSEKRMEVEGHPALEMQASARGNSLVDCKYILDGNRLYMVMVVTTVKEDREAKTVQRVMDSFKILKR